MPAVLNSVAQWMQLLAGAALGTRNTPSETLQPVRL
jgi:hypothetical protein